MCSINLGPAKAEGLGAKAKRQFRELRLDLSEAGEAGSGTYRAYFDDASSLDLSAEDARELMRITHTVRTRGAINNFLATIAEREAQLAAKAPDCSAVCHRCAELAAKNAEIDRLYEELESCKRDIRSIARMAMAAASGRIDL